MPPAKTNHVFLPVPSGGDTFKGSAVVTADQPIAVVANHFAAYGTDDTFMSHTGLNR
jgi:hypothetical protein